MPRREKALEAARMANTMEDAMLESDDQIAAEKHFSLLQELCRAHGISTARYQEQGDTAVAPANAPAAAETSQLSATQRRNRKRNAGRAKRRAAAREAREADLSNRVDDDGDESLDDDVEAIMHGAAVATQSSDTVLAGAATATQTEKVSEQVNEASLGGAE